ncbi:UbiH/UbiF family hydroxylase [Burkholderia vietnamiensis]|jgi:ubiquinone biosynthesis UbiH/UbiF/VisC/COQ6 family hydroxylase|uniref:2-octaprenyl-3-methyl-6-methoxy-1,4-benzoquinol hydroxylase n=2 Tax=Burkholderia vietnamiensis TaxID=60552 RepID=A4JB61_BURVG|nr:MULTISPECIES: UbiH/UbiF family hydroxylase [Burkholderia]ABO53514.1 2-octaprenyl-3-methyl-6-methoxy-1,4-benzoquinol hydroxylase [Burkholderia vietnamiensis G4]TPQ48352.1 ubiquinone biosynthesis protein [Burkholderia ubonensis]AOJ97568.1 ubiquinone biosynthesis protein [Burkholderia vietnamiensis]AOK09146.1 ubiquinone biosynthesis protein [Burkholderia vietnamiensis]AOK39950.1 ubiquinone biosynthesis protein [Burkholderia vietnamiensis]
MRAMTAHHTFDVAVVGGGLVGKTAALALTQSGYKTALLAQPATPRPADLAFDTRIYALSSSSQALLERLRVWQALDHGRLAPVYDMRVYGDAHAELHFSAYQASVPQLAWIVESSLIETSLDAALRFQPNLTWFDARAQGFDVRDDAAVLTLSSGHVVEADLVVGADGAHSWVRSQMGAKVERRDYRQTGVVANFKASLPHRETAYQWFHEGEIIALLPLPDGHVSLVWSAQTAHADQLLALDPAQLAAEVERVSHGQVGTLECVTPAAGFPLALQTVDKLIAPRVALVGDAAHLIHPLAGQGMNLGLRDVASLADAIASKESFRNLGDTVLLRRYERARREDIRALMVATDGLQRLFSVPGPLAKAVRNAGMAFVGAQPLVKRWLVSAALG